MARLAGVAGRDGPGPAQPGAEPMSKLSDTQAIILSAACQRPDGNLLPLPGSLRGGAAAKVVAALLARGLAEERVLDSGHEGRRCAQHRLAQPRRRPRRPAADHSRRARGARHRADCASRSRSPAAARSAPHRLTRLGRVPECGRGRRPLSESLSAAAGHGAGGDQAGGPGGDARPTERRHHRRDRRSDRLAAAHGARRLRRGAEEAARADASSPEKVEGRGRVYRID